MRKNILDDRSQSGFPVSIGTGLALETIFEPVQDVVDEDRKVEPRVDTSRYTLYLFNVETLIRNMLSSCTKEDFDRLNVDMVYTTLVEELSYLTDHFINNQLRIEFFYNTYEYYKSRYEDRIKVRSTPKQIFEDTLTYGAIKKLLKDSKGVHKFSHQTKFDSGDRVLILTHLPVDLLSRGNYMLMDLLESHTGKVKHVSEFNTKYLPVGDADMSFLPFFEYLLVNFGDKHMFKPMPIKVRKELLRSLTTVDINPMMSEFSFKLRGKK